jgi:hypothetical protein
MNWLSRWAHELLTIVKNCLRPDEYREAFDCFFEESKAGLEAYESQANILRNRP